MHFVRRYSSILVFAGLLLFCSMTVIRPIAAAPYLPVADVQGNLWHPGPDRPPAIA